MEDTGRYDISFAGEFADKALEREFIYYYMKCYSRLIGTVALIFGVIYMLFIFYDYSAVKSPSSFMFILIIRALFLMMSAVAYFAVKKLKDYYKLAYLITAYEVWAIVSFMMIIYQYKSISFMSFFSVMAITLAVYFTPNRLINVQAVTIFFNLSFLILFANRIESIETGMPLKIAVCSLIFIVFGSIGTYLVGFSRRRQFADGRELLRLSITDSLTGIYNRAEFDRELNLWVDYCIRYEHTLSLVIFDVDDFKKINDNYGHLTGDSVLQNIASIIKKVIRSTDIFARWGGDEFVMLLPNTDAGQAMEMMERIRLCIQKNKYGRVENVTCSFGLTSFQKSDDAESLLQKADRLLYIAKGRGKNIVVCGTGKIGEEVKTSHR